MDAVERVRRAWTDPGPQPEYHRRKQAELRRDWPALAIALDAMVKAPPQSAPERS